MTNSYRTVVIFWQTTRKKRDQKCEALCRDYGMTMLSRGIFVGLLKEYEKEALCAHIVTVLTDKRSERFYHFSFCKKCTNNDILKTVEESIGSTTQKYHIVD